MQHTVKKYENLTVISKLYGVPISDIMKANSKLIKNENVIEEGWRITIPVKPNKNYNEIGKAFEKCLNDIEKLPSFKALSKLI